MRIRALAVTAAAVLLGGCGTIHAGTRAADSPGASVSPAKWGTYGPSGSQLVRPRTGGSGRVLTVGVQLPTGRYGCERDLTGKVTGYSPTMASLAVTYQSRLYDVEGTCPWRVITIRVRLPAPLGQRDVMFNGDTTFTSGRGRLTLQCGALNGAGCGIPPPLVRASCTTPSYQQAMSETAPPMHAVYGVLGCQGRWLALTVGWPGGASGCDGSSCNPDMASTYWFFRARPHGWEPIATSRTAGCASVHKAEPRFPARLCAALPALSG